MMKILEEYVERNSLDVPVINWDSSSHLLMVSKEPPYKWRILDINLRSSGYQPTTYEMILKEPLSNSCGQRRQFYEIFRNTNNLWESYNRDVIFVFDSYLNGFKPVDNCDLRTSLLSIYFVMCEKWMTANISMEQLDYFYKALMEPDPYLRSEYADKVFKFIWRTELRDLYSHVVEPLNRRNSRWLENLINV